MSVKKLIASFHSFPLFPVVIPSSSAVATAKRSGIVLTGEWKPCVECSSRPEAFGIFSRIRRPVVSSDVDDP